MDNYDFGGYATRNDLLCTDGRTIRRNAFANNDGCKVPLIWNHDHSNPNAVLGHAILENRNDGVYAYCVFNDTEQGETAKKLVQHGDVSSLSIWANQLKQIGGDIIHGNIRELSLVLAGANPGAFIDFVMEHGDGDEDGLIACYDENITIFHSAESPKKEEKEDNKDMSNPNENVGQSKKDSTEKKDKTIQDIIDTMNSEQQDAVNALVGIVVENLKNKDSESEEKDMKHNVFEGELEQQDNVLSHSDEMQIMALAQQSNVGSFKQAFKTYVEETGKLAHSAIDGEVLDVLFPDYKDVYPGEPETLTDDQTWIDAVISGTHKSPVSRIRTRQLDARNRRNRAHGYKKGKYKEEGTNVALINRTTDPQTILIKDSINRDDIVDFTDFDIVNYQWNLMRRTFNEELALAILIGDGREEGEADKIYETHIRSILNDDELYTIHKEIDLDAAKTALQGSNTSANFSDNYIYAEAVIEASLFAREEYKGSGSLVYLCTPHSLNKMLLARDINGRRIYSSKADLQAALNVRDIITVEQFDGIVRKDSSAKEHALIGIYVNFSDYVLGSTKGGEITKFDQFDIDFNRQKMLLEARVSGALSRVKSAIVIEEAAE